MAESGCARCRVCTGVTHIQNALDQQFYGKASKTEKEHVEALAFSATVSSNSASAGWDMLPSGACAFCHCDWV